MSMAYTDAEFTLLTGAGSLAQPLHLVRLLSKKFLSSAVFLLCNIKSALRLVFQQGRRPFVISYVCI